MITEPRRRAEAGRRRELLREHARPPLTPGAAPTFRRPRCRIRRWIATRRWVPVITELLDRARAGDGEAFRASRRASSPRAATALLPDARLAPRRRGRAAGHAARRVAWPRRVRGALVTADVAVPGGNQPVSEHPARQPATAGRRPAAPRRRRAGGEPQRRGDLARALPRRPRWVGPTSRRDPKLATRRAKRSRSRSSPHSRRSRRASAPSSSCATCSATAPARSRRSSTRARSP